MPDRPSESALLQAVELLMGQFSEQILALLEAHARGDVEAEAFEARIRELVGAVSPEAVARHPGRLALVRPAPESDVFAAPEPEATAAPEAEPCLELEISPLPATPEPPAEPLAEPESSLEPPAILDGVSGFEPLPDYGWEAPPAEPEPGAAPEPDVFAAPEPEAAAAPEAAPCLELEIPPLVEPAEPAVEPEVAQPEQTVVPPLPVESSPEPPAPEPAAAEAGAAPGPESPAILDGVSGYEHLLEPEEPSPPPPPVPAAASRPAPPKAGPAAPVRPRREPPKDVAAAPPAPSRPPAGRPVAPAKPAPRPEAPPAATPAKPAAAPGQPAAGPAKAPPPCRPRPTGMGGNVVVSGRTGADDFRRPDRQSLGFGDQMFGKGDKEVVGDHATSFVSRQVRKDLQDKVTWKSPTKAALLSGLLPGVGDFYLGKVGNGLVFYLLFYVLLMLLILRGDLVLVGALAVVAMLSSGMSWLGAHKHNEAIHRIKDAPSMQKKTRETTFTFDTSRRRR